MIVIFFYIHTYVKLKGKLSIERALRSVIKQFKTLHLNNHNTFHIFP